MNALTKAGKIIFALPFAIFGILHFGGAKEMASMVPLPGAEYLVYLVGLCLIGAAVSLIINKMTKISMILLAVLMVIFIAVIHVPLMGNPMTAAFALPSILKDLALAGGALTFAGLASAQAQN